MMRSTGYYQNIGQTSYFIPLPLPPSSPDFIMSVTLTELYGKAMLELGQLNEIARNIPNIFRFIKAYVIKEALLSSAIEDIHTTLLEVFTQPLSDELHDKSTQLVINYTHALDAALHLMLKDNLPISTRLILQAHSNLMEGQGSYAQPGSYRNQSVKVGNLVPPPAQSITQLMSELDEFINNDPTIPSLIKAGLAHVQFETIHPFIDGNGRIGRLLIVLMLIDYKILDLPILYPSYYFKKHRSDYYHALDRVRTHGDFEGWVQFYLQAIIASTQDAYIRARDIKNLEQELEQKILNNIINTRTQELMLRTLSLLFESPVTTISQLAKKIDKSYNTTAKIIDLFCQHTILIEHSSVRRNKIYRFDQYLELLEKEY